MVAPLERDGAPALPTGHVLLVPHDASWDAVADWMAAGLRRREQVIHASAGQPSDDLLMQRLAVAHRLDVATLRSRGQLRSATVEEFYAPREQESVVTSALAEGYSGVRVCGAADQALEQMSVEEYDAVEGELNDLCRRYPFSALCRYGQDLLRDNQDLSVGHHPVVTDALGCVATWTPGGPVVKLSGEFDLANAELLRSAVARAAPMPPGSTLVMDLGAVSFFGLAGVRSILAATEGLRADGGTVMIQAAGSGLGRIFELLDLTQVAGIRLDGELQ